MHAMSACVLSLGMLCWDNLFFFVFFRVGATRAEFIVFFPSKTWGALKPEVQSGFCQQIMPVDHETLAALIKP